MKIIKHALSHSWRLILVAILLAISIDQTYAQDIMPISFEKVLELGGADNLTIKEYKQRQELSLSELAQARQWWLPEIFVGVQTQQLWGAAMNSDGRFFLDVNRQNLWNGIGLNANWNFADGVFQAKSANLNNEASSYRSKAERNRQLLHIINAYFDMLTAQLSLQAYESLINQSDSIIDQIQVQVDGGLRYESELLLAKSNKNHLQVEMLNTKRQFQRTSGALKKLLNIDQNIELISADEPLMLLDISQDLQTSDASLHLHRPEWKANDFELKALEMKRKTVTTGMLIPELHVETGGSYFGRIKGNVSPMFPDQYPETKQLYPTGRLNVSLLWKLPLGELAYRGDRKHYDSELMIKEIESQQIKAVVNEELANARSDLQLGKKQVETSRDALGFTVEALNQSIARQKLGTAKPFEVFQAQQFFLQSQLDYVKAIGTYNKAQYALKVAMGEDL